MFPPTKVLVQYRSHQPRYYVATYVGPTHHTRFASCLVVGGPNGGGVTGGMNANVSCSMRRIIYITYHILISNTTTLLLLRSKRIIYVESSYSLLACRPGRRPDGLRAANTRSGSQLQPAGGIERSCYHGFWCFLYYFCYTCVHQLSEKQ